jgi:hypothetical protein
VPGGLVTKRNLIVAFMSLDLPLGARLLGDVELPLGLGTAMQATVLFGRNRLVGAGLLLADGAKIDDVGHG